MLKFNAIGIVCADIERSIAFYRMLGVDLPKGSAAQGHVEADLGGGVRLMLDSHDVLRQFVADFEPPAKNEAISFAVECDSPDGVDETYAQLTGSGADSVREPFDAFWGQRYATVEDPDGNGVDLYAALPAE